MIRYSAAAVMAVFAFPLAGQMRFADADLTVVLDFRGAHGDVTTRELQREADRILRPSGIELAWIPRREATGVYRDLVVMTFTGSCQFDMDTPAYYTSGPLAWTSTVAGEVLPFGDVECGKVVNSVRTAMWSGERGRADLLVGRALGRVVAHELVHMLTKSAEHSHEGIEQPALSGRQLIEPSLALSAVDIDRLRKSVAIQEMRRSLKDSRQEIIVDNGR